MVSVQGPRTPDVGSLSPAKVEEGRGKKIATVALAVIALLGTSFMNPLGVIHHVWKCITGRGSTTEQAAIRAGVSSPGMPPSSPMPTAAAPIRPGEVSVARLRKNPDQKLGEKLSELDDIISLCQKGGSAESNSPEEFLAHAISQCVLEGGDSLRKTVEHLKKNKSLSFVAKALTADKYPITRQPGDETKYQSYRDVVNMIHQSIPDLPEVKKSLGNLFLSLSNVNQFISGSVRNSTTTYYEFKNAIDNCFELGLSVDQIVDSFQSVDISNVHAFFNVLHLVELSSNENSVFQECLFRLSLQDLDNEIQRIERYGESYTHSLKNYLYNCLCLNEKYQGTEYIDKTIQYLEKKGWLQKVKDALPNSSMPRTSVEHSGLLPQLVRSIDAKLQEKTS